MGLLAVDLALIRDVLVPGLTLTPGRALMARVVSADEGSGGRLALAGYLLDAKLPGELAAGDSLRLVVRDVNAERVLLAVTPQEPVPQPPDAPVALPGGAKLAVLEDGGDDAGRGGADGGQSFGLRLDLPVLGTLELRFTLDPGAVRAAIAADPGEPVVQAHARVDELRDALTRVAERPATVTVTTRHEPLDVYA